jgi:hypothetical protein
MNKHTIRYIKDYELGTEYSTHVKNDIIDGTIWKEEITWK